MKVLLVAMYAADQQYSLQGFAGALHTGLAARGHDVRVVAPRVVLGKIKAPGLGKWLSLADKFGLFPRELKRAARWANVVHFVDHGHAVYTKHVQNMPHVVTCNDLIAAKAALGELPEWKIGGMAPVFQRMILEGLRAARHVVCISDATREDVLRMARVPPERVSRIYDALFHPYSPMPLPESAALLEPLGLARDDAFFLHVGRDVPTKNRRGLVQIFRALRRHHGLARARLVLTGKPLASEMRQFIREQDMQNSILELSHLSDAHLRALYSQAQALVFPSLHEGFGLPIIEAQACGCPVFTSNRAPMTEVGGDAAVYFDPAKPEEAAQTIADNLGRAEAIRAAGFANVQRFTTERMIDEYLATYRMLLGK